MTRDLPKPFPKPFLKRVGGKRQLLPVILPHVPKRFRAYREPFVGGGALFWRLRREGPIYRAHLSDACPHLIATYTVVRDDVEALIRDLSPLRNDAGEYYRLRDRFNEVFGQTAQEMLFGPPVPMMGDLEEATLFLYFAKTAFNGLWRVNGDGEFNASWAGYENPAICDADNLRACHAGLQGVDIQCRDFAAALAETQEGDFVYADPPYVPVTATANFTGYCADRFSMRDQVRLRDAAVAAKGRGVHVLLSNSSAPAVYELYRGWTIETIDAKRAVNCKGEGRGPVKEVLIW